MDNDNLLCQYCYRKESRGTTAGGALAAGDVMYNAGKYEDARAYYQEAMNILNAQGGCSLCRQRTQRIIDRC